MIVSFCREWTCSTDRKSAKWHNTKLHQWSCYQLLWWVTDKQRVVLLSLIPSSITVKKREKKFLGTRRAGFHPRRGRFSFRFLSSRARRTKRKRDHSQSNRGSTQLLPYLIHTFNYQILLSQLFEKPIPSNLLDCKAFWIVPPLLIPIAFAFLQEVTVDFLAMLQEITLSIAILPESRVKQKV